MSKWIIVSIILFLVILFGFIFISSRQENPKNILLENTQQQPTSIQTQVVDIQASFAIYTNGTFRVFTAAMYHNLSEGVFIQAENPNIVHVKKSGITWNDFFSTLPFKLTQDCLTTGTEETFCTGASDKLQFYLNGNIDDNALNKGINAGDQLLVTFGKEDAQQTQEQIQKLRNMIN